MTITERSLVRRLSRALRFADFMALLMVAATGFSAFATWRTAQMTSRIFTIAERPYIGILRSSFETIDSSGARLVIDFRNFGTVSAEDGVAQFHLLVDGRPLPKGNDAPETIVNIGMISPSVPHPFHLFIPLKTYEAVRAGQAKLIVHTFITYRGPDERQFCYNETVTYDSRAGTFDPNGGSDRCDGAIY